MTFVPLNLDNDATYSNLKFILTRRIPRSLTVYNMVMAHPKWAERNKYFWLKTKDEENLGEGSWIIVRSYREDKNTDISISPPYDPKITEEIREAFESNDLLDWGHPYIFSLVERPVSQLMLEISCFVKGNVSRCCPCYVYYIEPPEAKDYRIDKVPPNIVVQRLNPSHSSFFVKEWKYSTAGTEAFVEAILHQNPSIGLFVDGTLVSGMLTKINGEMSMLNTTSEYRNKGYGSICMKSLMKLIAEEGMMIPCSAAEISNEPSVLLHEKVGMKRVYKADYISSNGKA